MRSCLSYLGGKSRLAPVIVKEIKPHICYCEPFCGGCWVLFEKEPSKCEVINDIDSELVTFWRVIQNHIEEFFKYYKHAVVSREIFDLENRRDPDTLTDIQRATRYFYLQKLGFGGKTHDRTFGTGATRPGSLNLFTLEDTLLEIHWRLARVTIEHLKALECIRRYDRDKTFFYIDPPYYDTAGYGTPFEHEDYVVLAERLGEIDAKFLLSLNDHPQVRSIFSAFRIRKIKTRYSVSNGRSCGSARSKPASEVFISNY